MFLKLNYISALNLTHQATKCNCWTEACKVDEEECSQTLHVKAVSQVTHVFWKTSFYIANQPTKNVASSFQRVINVFKDCKCCMLHSYQT